MPLIFSRSDDGETWFATTDGIRDAVYTEDDGDSELDITYVDGEEANWTGKTARDFRDALIALSVNKPAPAVEKPLDDDATDLIQ